MRHLFEGVNDSVKFLPGAVVLGENEDPLTAEGSFSNMTLAWGDKRPPTSQDKLSKATPTAALTWAVARCANQGCYIATFPETSERHSLLCKHRSVNVREPETICAYCSIWFQTMRAVALHERMCRAAIDAWQQHPKENADNVVPGLVACTFHHCLAFCKPGDLQKHEASCPSNPGRTNKLKESIICRNCLMWCEKRDSEFGAMSMPSF